MTTAGLVDILAWGEIVEIRLVNPDRRNAISVPMWETVLRFATDVAALRDVRVVTIRGDGDMMFSSGADIGDFAALRAEAGPARAYDDLIESTCRAVEGIAVPTVAIINGPCIGAGASLAASCDLRIAKEDAALAVPAARLGLGYDPRGIARFLRVFGAGPTRELLLAAEHLPATRAYELGIFHRIASADRFPEAVRAFVEGIAANAPLTLAAAKAALHALSAVRAEPPLDDVWSLVEVADASEDYREGRRAFAERRPPRFKGR